jgi:branched-chain amino acid aminotransferase
MQCWFNGEFCEDDSLLLSLADPVFLGRGCFETMLAREGRLVAWTRHRARLQRAIKALGFWEQDFCHIESLSQELLARNGLMTGEARVRLLVTASAEMTGSVLLSAHSYCKPAGEVSLVTSQFSSHERAPTAGIKSLSYESQWQFLREAQDRGADDVLFGNSSEELVEASMANVIVRDQGLLKTPPLSSGCLPGVTREILLELAPEIREESIPFCQVDEFEEIWLCNSLRRLQYASKVNGRALPPPRDDFRALAERLEHFIEKETSKP